jgi:chromate reductase
VQYHLRQVLNSMGAYTMGKPEVFISMAQSKFSAEGELTDETTRKFISEWLVALQKHKARLG